MDFSRKVMRVSDIKIKPAFRRTTPRALKMNFCRRYYEEYGVVDKDIIVNKKGVLLDGYIRYLVLKENEVEDVEVVMINDRAEADERNVINGKTYVFGRHETCDKEFCWVVNNGTHSTQHMKIGNKAIVRTVNGNKKVTVVRIERLENPPYPKRIRSVVQFLDE